MKYKKIAAFFIAAAVTGIVLSGCGNTINANAVAATLDGKEISLGLANFVARYQQATFDSYYLSWLGDDMWTRDINGEGNSFQEDVKSDVMDGLETMYLLEAHMADYDVKITEEDTKAMEAAADKFLTDNSQKAIAQVGATKEYIVEMLRLNTIQSRMRKAIEAEADTNVSDEEAKQRTFSYVSISKTDDSSAADAKTEGDGSGSASEADAAADAQKKAEAESYAKEAAADFDKAAENAGYTVSTASYGSAKDENLAFDAAVLEAADKLKEGQVSALVETDSNYYVLRLDSEFDKDATETKKESIISERKSKRYEEVLDGYKKDVTWEINEDVWETVSFDELFTQTQKTEGTGSLDETENAGVSDETENASVSDATEKP